VSYCEEHGLTLEQLSDEQLAEVSPRLTPAVKAVLSVPGSIAARDGRGGTSPASVQRQLAEVAPRLEAVLARLA